MFICLLRFYSSLSHDLNLSLLLFFDGYEKVRYSLVFTKEILHVCKNVTIKKDLWHELQNPLCKVIVMAFILSKFYCSVFCVLKSFQFLSRKFMYYKITQKAFSHKKTSFPKTYSPHLLEKVKHTSYYTSHGTTTYQTH